MELEEHTLEEPYEPCCQICGVELTEPEIHIAREANGPFLCSVHAAEELPAQDDEAPDSQSSATGAAGPGQPGP
jgi:hypothetical protein